MVVLLLTFLSLSEALALETDNYIVWGKELNDSSQAINQYLKDEIQLALKESKPQESCLGVTKKIAKRFKSYLVHHNPVENWVIEHLGAEFLYPVNMNYVSQSIYQDPFRSYIPKFGLSPNIQVNGYYFGTDKLSHFASTGMTYYLHYLRERKNHVEDIAVVKAMELGVLDERTLHGHWASGVFSYADLEANYQGFLFYKNLCSRLTKNSEWILRDAPQIQSYVSGLWDESYYLSYRLPENWEKVAPVLKAHYCPRKAEPKVLARFNYYSETHPHSHSWRYLEAKRPHEPQSFQNLCGN